MFLPDLAPYGFLDGDSDDVVAVGWLDREHEFVKGFVPEFLLTRILALCFRPVNQTRGFHQSPFLSPSPLGYPVEFEGKEMLLGSAEIRVSGKGGRSYAAPNLIYHYIRDCGYLPPQEFLDAVESLEDSSFA